MNHRPHRLLIAATATLLVTALSGALRGEDYAITTFAGVTLSGGSDDGTPGKFNNPYGIAIDSAKNLYIADTTNQLIRKISPSRVVSTLAGSAGVAGSVEGAGSAARFDFPVGIAVDAAGNVYVADSRNSVIRKITSAGVGSTFAGALRQFGSSDGPAASARFFLPCGVAVDTAGNVYVTDTGNHTVRKITPEGVVSTLAGTAQQPGSVNGTGAAARFNSPWGITVDGSGNIYVTDSNNHVIRRITSAGAVTTVAGTLGAAGGTDGTATAARFNSPRGLSINSAGELFVADYGNSVIRHITPAGVVTTIAGAAGIVGATDSVGAAARFYDTTDLVADGSTIYVVDSSNNLIRRGLPASAAPLPVINVQPLDQNVAVGQPISFRVTATGSALTYQWLRNQVPIEGATNSTYTIAEARSEDSASYHVRISGAGGSIDSGRGNLTVTPVGSAPIQITARPVSQSVGVGERVTFSVAASGPGLTYQWLRDGASLTGATGPTHTIAAAQPGDAGTYSVRITSGATTETAVAKLVVGGSTGGGTTPITITQHPTAALVEVGRSVNLSVAASGTNLTYQWYKDGAAVVGATNTTYNIPSAQQANAGTYFVRVASGAISSDSNPALVTIFSDNPDPGPTARLSNLSVRTAMTAGQRLIVGFYVDGGSRQILVRASGPALAALGLGGTMADPTLESYSGSTLVLSNDNWDASLASTFSSVGAFGFPAGSRDAAFLQSVNGSASVHALGSGAGIVLVEAYDTGSGNTPRMTNLSARNRVGTGDDILIAGFAVSGTGNKRLLIRASGPGLAALGVSGTLANPRLEVFNHLSAKIAENEDWDPALATTFSSVGAFGFPSGSRDAALVTTLDAGTTYTVQVRGSDGGTGEALIEVYELP